MNKPDDKAARALELVAKGVSSAAICERLGISRNRLYQIKHYAQKSHQSNVTNITTGERA